MSSEKRTSTAPPLDDLSKFEKQDSALPAGKVRVILEGGVDPSQPVSLVELTPKGRTVFGTGKPSAGPPDPSDVQGQADFNPNVDMKPGALVINVHGGMGSTNTPFSGELALDGTPAIFPNKYLFFDRLDNPARGEVAAPPPPGTTFNDQLVGVDVPVDPNTGFVDLVDRAAIDALCR